MYAQNADDEDLDVISIALRILFVKTGRPKTVETLLWIYYKSSTEKFQHEGPGAGLLSVSRNQKK